MKSFPSRSIIPDLRIREISLNTPPDAATRKYATATYFVAPLLLALLLGCALPLFGQAPAPSVSSGRLVYVGTYTGAKSKGIYSSRMDEKTGALTPLELAAETPNPTFLAVHPNRRFLYAANEIGNFAGKKAGAVSAFGIDLESGKLTPLNQQSSGGDGPCHLLVDKTGKNVLVANYGGGSVVVLPIQADGRLGEATAFIQHHGSSVNPQRQEGPHGHCVTLDLANRFALVCDLGLDQVLVYQFNPARGTLVPNDPPFASIKAGSGPRHLAFDPRGRYAYVINEMSSTITVFAYNKAKGALRELQTVSTLPIDFNGNTSTAEIEVHRSGKFLYGSNRGHNSLAIFAIESGTGRLSEAGHQSTEGKTPRNFGMDPSGRFLLAANQDSDTIVVFQLDPQTGRLKPAGPVLEVPTPVCVQFVPKKQ